MAHLQSLLGWGHGGPPRPLYVSRDGVEECDDGNRIDNDCCSNQCKAQPANSCPDTDGNPCIVARCNAAGVCVDGIDPQLGIVGVVAPRGAGIGVCPEVDGDPCTVPQCNGDGICDEFVDLSKQCTIPNAGACTFGQCVQGALVNQASCESRVVDCSANAGTCFSEVCDPELGCRAPKAAGSACDDGNGCTPTSECDESGRCVGSTFTTCADAFACTSDSCVSTGPTTAVCSHQFTTDPCADTDGNACTVAQCFFGSCDQTRATLQCPEDQCKNAGTCDPQQGCVQTSKPDGTACTMAPPVRPETPAAAARASVRRWSAPTTRTREPTRSVSTWAA